jgi:hypothetical protein
METQMVDRHYFGDLAFAVLLVLPLAGLARAQPISHHRVATPHAVDIPSGGGSPEGRISILG